MEDLSDEERVLVEDVLSALTDKFSSLPVMNRNLLAIATVEAAAVVVAVEAESHAELLGYERAEIEDRIEEYIAIFRSYAMQAVSDL